MLDSFRIESASVSDRGLNEKRPHNEDSFLEVPARGIFAVADGVGGAEAGEVASQMAVEILAEAFANDTELSDAEEVMRLALEQANDAIHRMANELPQLSSMATTIVALHVAGNIATIGHVGDSRLYRLDADGALYQETADHSMVAEEVRAGRMTAEQAENHPGKNIISRALGAEPTVEVDLKTIMVGPDTTFLICSDGVTRHVSDGELSELLRSGERLGDICEKIKNICFERGAEDNLTAVLVRLLDAGVAVPSDDGTDDDGEIGERTVATARRPAVGPAGSAAQGDELLELETAELTLPDKRSSEHPSPPSTPREQAPSAPPSSAALPVSEGDYETSASIPVGTEISGTNAGPSEPAFVSTSETRSGAFGKIVGSVALLLIGSLMGLAGYHYFLANRTVPTVTEPITEMKSSNPQLTAFEDNRRAVDKDPEAGLKIFLNEPKDASNLFLVGRAYLLTGKFPEAHKALNEASELIDGEIAQGTLDAKTGQTLKTDIAIALTVTNDTMVQNNLKKELERTRAANGASAPAAHGNRSPIR